MTTKYFKIIDSKKGNNGWMYFIGIHDLKDKNEEFNTKKECVRGGLYYTTPEFILEFLSYGDMLCEVIPLGQIIEIEHKFKTNRLEIISVLPLNEISTWEFMRENGCPLNKYVCLWAVQNNNLEILKWAHENGCPLDERIFRWAAKNNNLEMLKWARENGCPWDERVCYWAIENNNLEMLKWAHEMENKQLTGIMYIN